MPLNYKELLLKEIVVQLSVLSSVRYLLHEIHEQIDNRQMYNYKEVFRS